MMIMNLPALSLCLFILGLSCRTVTTQNVMVTPVDPTVTYGSNLTLTCSYDDTINADNLTIEWTTTASNMDLSSVAMASDISSNLTLTNVDFSRNGNYTCDVVDDNTQGSNTIVLTVNLPAPSDISISPPSPSVVYNNDITITCQVRSLTAPDITWTTNATAGIVGQSDVMSQGEIHTRDLVLTGVRLNSTGSYTCTATNQGGSVNTTAMLDVNVPAPSDISISPPSPSVVYNNDITITCQVRSLTAPDITWTTNATAGIVGQSDVMSQGEIHTRDLVLTGVTLDSIGSYTCTATNEGGSNNTNAMLTVNVPPPSDLTITPNPLSVNHSEIATFTCTVTSLTAPSITWTGPRVPSQPAVTSQGSDVYTSSLELTGVRLNSTGSYTCTATNQGGSVNTTAMLDVNVPPPSDLTITPSPLSVNHSETATFTCTVTSLTTPSITWTTDATAGITSQPTVLASSQGSDMYTSSLELTGVRLNSTGSYTCTATNEGGSINTTAMLTVTVPAPSDISISPPSPSVVYNNDITITCQVRSLTAPDITWTTNATAGIVGQSDVMSQGEIHTRDLVLTGVTLDSIGSYTCTATNEGGSNNTNAMLTVNVPPPSDLTITPNPLSVNHSEIATFTCTVTSLTAPSITWTGPRVPSQPAVTSQGSDVYTSSLELTGVTLDSIGSYTCTATNQGGSVNTTAMLTVTVPPPSVSIPNDSITITYGMDLTLNCTVSSIFLPFTAEWRSGQTVIKTMNYTSAPTGPFQVSITNVNGSTAGVYTCVATHDHGNNNDTVSVIVYIPPPSDLTITPSSLSVNHSETATFTCTVTSLTTPNITWTTTANTSITSQPTVLASSQGSDVYTSRLELTGVTLNSIGSYTCTATNEGGSVNTTAMLDVTVPTSGVMLSSATLNVTYNGTLQLNCTIFSVTPPVINWNTTANITIPNESIVTMGTGNMYKSVLTINNVDLSYTGLYTCSSTNEGGTESDDSDVTVILPVPTVSIPSDLNVTYADSFSIMCNVTSLMRPSSIVWYHNDTMLSVGAQPVFTATGPPNTYTSVLDRDNLTLTDSGVYRCEAQNIAGIGADNITISVIVPLPVILDLNDLNVTIGLNVTLNCTASGFGLTYEWETVPCSHGCMVDGLDSPLLTIGPIVNGLKGEYVCTVTDFIGQTVSKIINITPLGPTLLSSNVSNCPVKEGSVCIGNCDATPIQVINGTNEFLQCSFQNRPDAPYNLSIDWYISRPRFGTLHADNATTFVTTTPEDENRIVTTTISFDPVNYLNFISEDIKDYEHVYLCAAFIGGFRNDRTENNGTCLEGLFGPVLTREPEENSRANLGDKFPFKCDPTYSNPRAILEINKILTNGTEVNLYNGQSMRYSIENVSFDNAGNYTCVLTNPYGRTETNFRLIVQSVPNQVTIVEIQYLSLFEIVIAWYIPSSNFGLNQGYNVEYRLELTGANSSNITVEEPYHILTDLDVNRNYSAVISSFNEVGRGPFSDVIIFPSISSGNASLLRVRTPSIFITSTQIQILWERSPLFRPLNRRPGIIDRYVLTYRATDSPTDIPVPFSNNSLTHTIESLSPNTEYIISINVEYSKPSNFKGNPVNIIAKTKPADNLPEVSTDLGSSNINDTTNPSIQVKWQPLSPEDGSDFLQRYVVRVNVTDLAASRGSRRRRQTNPVMTSLEYNVSTGENQFDFIDIKPFMSYSIGVNAALLVNGLVREVPITRPATVDSPESIPTAPINFRFTEINFTYVQLAWDPPDPQNGIILSYQIDWEGGGRVGSLGGIIAELRTTRISGLTGDVTYTFKIRARTSAGLGNEAEITNSTYAGVAPFGAPTLVENTDYSDRLNVLVGSFSYSYGQLRIYKIIVVTSPNVNGPIPESTLYSYSDDNWRQYNYYVTALDYHNSQNTTLVIGTGNIYTFEGGARYIDAPLESGRSYRVFIRLYSSASDPENPYRDSPMSNTIEISTPLNLAYILVPIFVVIFLIILAVIAIIVICFVCNKRQNRKQESFYLEEISKTEASMKQSSNGSQRTPSVTVSAKATTPEGRAGLYTPTLSVNNSSVYTSTGQPTLLMCESGGTPAPVISWHKEGMIIEEPDYVLFNDGSLYITNTKLKDQGHFIVRATNSVGVVEESVRVTVVSPSPPESDPNHPPLNVSDFIEMMALLQSNNSDRLEEEYPDIELEWNFTSYAAKLPINHSKNRYVNIIPYDHSRVTLKPDGNPGSDYINASFIGGITSPKDYIATQGPIPAAFPDFWRMIWEYNVPTIIMVTNLKEDDKIKCHQYWPSFGAANYGSFQVTLKEVETVADYAIRTFQLQSLHGQGSIKEVRQYHFLVWPDHGVPQYATPLLSFQKRVRNYHKGKPGPMVVHCSAGVGRTGTFITIDTMILKIDVEGIVDVFNFVRGMRFCRNYMVQTASQYDFLHHAILEAIMCRDTTIPAVHMATKIATLKEIVPSSGKTGFQSQFETLESSSPTDDDFDCSIAQLSDNLAKSRMKEHLPPNDYRVVLSTKNYDSDYICASYVDGYRQRSAFIAAQGPMKNTAGDFWRMVWEMKSMIIIMLTKTEENGEEQSVQYWPVQPNEEDMYGSFNVVALPEDRTLPDYNVRKFKLSHSNNPDDSRTITHFQYTNWPSTSCPKEATSIIDLVTDVVRIQRKSGNGPITVHCSDGLGRTGTFCAMFTVLERLKAEQVIDVFSTVKTLRIQRPGFVNDIEQYEFIHKAALEFVNTFDNYDNFKY